SVARRCAQSATSAACSVSSTMTRILSRPWTCWPSCVTTTSSSLQNCAKLMVFATSTAMLRLQVCWKAGSMKPSGAPGSCSRPRVLRNDKKACCAPEVLELLPGYHDLSQARLGAPAGPFEPGCSGDQERTWRLAVPTKRHRCASLEQGAASRRHASAQLHPF